MERQSLSVTCWPALVLILLTDRGDGFVDESTSERD